jgi:endoglucanase
MEVSMKMPIRFFLVLFFLFTLCTAGFSQPAGSPVARYGRLQVKEARICDERGRPVILRGMSTMGLQWYGGIVHPDAFQAIAKDWKADVIRLALYVGENGYAAKPELKELVKKGVDLAVSLGLYVIVDWHVLNPGNPNDPVYAGAETFFREMAAKYGATPNIIYEIMNEPNGRLDWTVDLKPYAQKMVTAIRSVDPDNLVLIGSGTWSQDVDKAAMDQVTGVNLAYTVHFYAGTHGQKLRDKIETALNYRAAVFCSEWGTSEANGTGGPFLEKAEEWLAFLEKKGIGWVNWSLCNKNETSAALKSQVREFVEGQGTVVTQEAAPLVPAVKDKNGLLVWPVEQLSLSGVYIRAKLRGETPSIVPAPAALRDASATDAAVKNDPGTPDEPGRFAGLPWNFEDGTRQGWTVAADSPAKVSLGVKSAGTKALAFSFAWTRPSPADPWSTAPRITSSNVDLPAARYTTLALDVSLEPGKARAGSLQIQPVIQSPQHGYWFALDPVTVAAVTGKDPGSDLLKYSLRIPLRSNGIPIKPDAIIRNLILITIGADTDYNGRIFFDNITFN